MFPSLEAPPCAALLGGVSPRVEQRVGQLSVGCYFSRAGWVPSRSRPGFFVPPAPPGDEESAELLEYHPLVLAVVRRVWRRWFDIFKGRVTTDELYSVGLEGAWIALRRIRGGSVPVSVGAFVKASISNAISDWLRSVGVWRRPDGSVRFGREVTAGFFLRARRNALNVMAVEWRASTGGGDVFDRVAALDALDELFALVQDPQCLELLRKCYKVGLSVGEAASEMGISCKKAAALHNSVMSFCRQQWGVEGEFVELSAISVLADRLGWSDEAKKAFSRGSVKLTDVQRKVSKRRSQAAFYKTPAGRESKRRENQRRAERLRQARALTVGQCGSGVSVVDGSSTGPLAGQGVSCVA